MNKKITKVPNRPTTASCKKIATHIYNVYNHCLKKT